MNYLHPLESTVYFIRSLEALKTLVAVAETIFAHVAVAQFTIPSHTLLGIVDSLAPAKEVCSAI